MNEIWEEQLHREVVDEFEDRKSSTTALIQSYQRLGMYERADKVSLCGTDLQFVKSMDPNESAKLLRANFCKDRLCWMCSWRRTKKIFGQVSQVMSKLEQEKEYRFVFVTLTVRSCAGPNLIDELDQMLSAFHKFNQRTRIKKAFKGGFRTLEVRYHPEHPTEFQFHHHLHIVYAVTKSYFNSRYYVSHDEIMQIWRDCCGIDYDPYVHIEIVKPSVGDDGEIGYNQVVAEVAKYTVKPEDIYVGRTDEEIDRGVWYLSQGLASRRLCSFTGVFKQAAAELKLDDLTEGDLVHTDFEKVRTDVAHMIIHYKWRVGYGYERVMVKHVTDEQIAEKEREHADRGARSRISRKVWREKVKTVNASRIPRKPV